ncbi:MAG: DUF2063 domain-containing protein [Candidatus Binataceae bacterium]
MSAPSLREIQRNFWCAIAGNLGGSSTDPQFVSMVAAGPNLGRDDRVQIYRDAYRLRLCDVLREDFPAIARHLGPDRFDRLVGAYLRDFPSQHPSVRHLGRAMGDFIARQQDLPPFLSDLARLEWAMTEVFDARDSDAIDVDVLRDVAQDRWADLVFVPIPALVLLRAEYQVHEVWAGTAPEVPSRSPVSIRVWRDRSWSVCHAAIDLREANALERMMRGEPFGAICEAFEDLPAEEAAQSATAMLANWLACGMIQRAI